MAGCVRVPMVGDAASATGAVGTDGERANSSCARRCAGVTGGCGKGDDDIDVDDADDDASALGGIVVIVDADSNGNEAASGNGAACNMTGAGAVDTVGAGAIGSNGTLPPLARIGCVGAACTTERAITASAIVTVRISTGAGGTWSAAAVDVIVVVLVVVATHVSHSLKIASTCEK